MSSDTHVSLIGGLKRMGHWVADRDITVVTLIGGARLDLSQAVIPKSGFTVNKYSLVGGVDIVVPPNVNVEISGITVFGGRDVARRADHDPDLPTIRVNAYGLFGGVSVREA